MQDPHKVKLVDASPKTREKLKIFLSTCILNECTIDGKKIKTLEDAVLFAIRGAEKVPELEARIEELVNENVKLRMRVAELEDVN